MKFPGRLGLQQRVLPSYRVPFFDMLASACEGGMSLFAGQARAEESIDSGKLQVANYAPTRNIHLLKGPLYLCYQRGVLDWLLDWNPDALIVEANPRYLSTPAAVKWMQRRGRPVIGWGLGAPPPSGSPHFLRNWGERRRRAFLSQFNGLIAYSQRGADEYAALGFPREKIFVAHNAASPAPKRALSPKPATFKLQPSILFVGRLQARKRIDALLRACAEMPDPGPRLVIVGDGPERGNLEALAQQVYPSAQFVGAKHGDELEPYFSEADLFVLPGTGGLAVQQAMSYGLPVIVAKGDGTQDDLVRPENGWQIPPEDYNALVATLRAALSDSARLRQMGAESYRIVSQEINLEKMVAAFVRALNSVF
ncbi:MAG: glycosyltransferase [Anaerolineales bacterium]|nr:glycosyltransferase [Anaerolineales bacterium]